MLQRVMPELMGMKSILAFNDDGFALLLREAGDGDDGERDG